MQLRTALFWTLLCLLLPAQDVVILKNGARLEGEIIHESADQLTLQFPGGSVRLPASQIDRVERVPVIEDAPSDPAQRLSKGLARFESQDCHYFLYRQGLRVGWRHLVIHRQLEGEIPGYLLVDRLIFLSDPGSAPDVELLVEEQVDPELRPVRARWRSLSGGSSREIIGRREGKVFTMVQELGGHPTRTSRLLMKGLRLPGIWLRSIGARAARTGRVEKTRLLELSRLSVREVSATGRRERVTLWGEPQLVDAVFLETPGRPRLASWLGEQGSPLREEIRTAGLVAIRAPQEMVEAYARGESSDGKSDLGLELLSERAGLRILRPNLAWEFAAGKPGEKRVLSLLRPAQKATVDLFLIDDPEEGATAESIAVKLLARMQQHAQAVEAQAPHPAKVGDGTGVVFECDAQREGHEIRTQVAVVRKDGRAIALFLAAPLTEFDRSRHAFQRILDSLRLFDSSRLNAEAEAEKEEEAPPGSGL